MSVLTMLVRLLDTFGVDWDCDRRRPGWLWPLCAVCRAYHEAGRKEGFWR